MKIIGYNGLNLEATIYIAHSTAFLGFSISSFISSYSLGTLFSETNLCI